MAEEIIITLDEPAAPVIVVEQSAVLSPIITVVETGPQGPPGDTVGGVTDHGLLTGLSDDDHPQYHTDTRGDARYYTKSAIDTSLAGKAATTHTHAQADVTGLVTALAGKASTSHTHAASDITSGVIAVARLGTGTPGTGNWLRGDGAFTAIDKTTVGLSNVDNTSDLLKPVSNATTTALAGKENTITAGLTTQYWRGDKTWVTLDKTAVGLANVDNTADTAKPVSTAQQTALNLKANLASPTFTGTVSGITAAMVGLGNVNNTSDANKPISTATQTALNSKADLVGGVIPTAQIPSISIIDFLGSVASQAAMLALVGQKGDWAIRTDTGTNWVITGNDPSLIGNWTQLAAAAGGVTSVNTYTGAVTLTKSDVGLGSVDNTSDAAKPVSTAQASALALKAPLASPTFTGTVSGITKAMVGLSAVDNTADASKPVSTAQQAALDLKAPLASPTFTGTVGGITKSMVGLANVDNTTDALKPISTATQAALDLKAPLASPTFTGTVSGITKAMVGLSAVDNTADSAKPVSTAQQTALNLKANLASPTFTGTVGGITKAMVGLSAVDNTADLDKPVSTATQAALDAVEASFPSALSQLTGTITVAQVAPRSVMRVLWSGTAWPSSPAGGRTDISIDWVDELGTSTAPPIVAGRGDMWIKAV